MPWLEGRIHEAGEVGNRIQRCRRCGRELAGLPPMLPPGMTPEQALAAEWETFDPGTLVREETSPTTRPGVYETRLEAIEDFDAATGSVRFCDDDSWWPPSEEPE